MTCFFDANAVMTAAVDHTAAHSACADMWITLILDAMILASIFVVLCLHGLLALICLLPILALVFRLSRLKGLHPALA